MCFYYNKNSILHTDMSGAMNLDAKPKGYCIEIEFCVINWNIEIKMNEM